MISRTPLLCSATSICVRLSLRTYHAELFTARITERYKWKFRCETTERNWKKRKIVFLFESVSCKNSTHLYHLFSLELFVDIENNKVADNRNVHDPWGILFSASDISQCQKQPSRVPGNKYSTSPSRKFTILFRILHPSFFKPTSLNDSRIYLKEKRDSSWLHKIRKFSAKCSKIRRQVSYPLRFSLSRLSPFSLSFTTPA